jgi:cytochrome b561
MNPTDPAYLTDAAVQIATLSAVLGGFAVTFFATLLDRSDRQRATFWTLGSAAGAAVLFIIATMASTFIAIRAHPEAPSGAASLGYQRVLAAIAFVAGIYVLLSALGLSGFIRSRRLGRVTAAAAAVGGGAVATLLFVRF